MNRIFASILIAILGARLGAAETTNPLPLAGLWAVSLGADFSVMSSQDIQALYPAGTLSLPESQVFPGLNLSLRKHVSDSFFLGAGANTIPKAYALQISPTGDTDNYDLNALHLYALGGLVWYRFLNSYSYVQCEIGAVLLNQAAFTRTGSNPQKGTFEGSGFAASASLGSVWLILPSLGLNLEGGYRRARMEHVNFSLKPGDVAIDDSGIYGRVQANIFWGMKNPWGDSVPLPEAPGAP